MQPFHTDRIPSADEADKGGIEIGTTYNVKTNDNDAPDLEFIQYRTLMRDDGKFTFAFDRVTYNDEAGSTGEGEVVTLIDTASATAVSVWVTPYPEALFEVAVTDGTRLITALIRAWSEELKGTKDFGADTVAAIASNENGGTLVVAKATLESGHDAWRWTVTPRA